MAVTFICAFTFSSLSAQGVKKKVRFAKGRSSITIREAVVRGDRDRYFVGAKAGQKMTVKITSIERTPSFKFFWLESRSPCPAPVMETMR
jgi:hypothetical protein